MVLYRRRGSESVLTNINSISENIYIKENDMLKGVRRSDEKILRHPNQERDDEVDREEQQDIRNSIFQSFGSVPAVQNP